MTIAGEELDEATLRDGWKVAGLEPRRQLLHRAVAQDGGRVAITSDSAGQDSQLEVHLGCHVVRQTAHDRLQLLGDGCVAEQLAGKAEQGQAHRGRRDDPRYERDAFVEEHSFGEVEPLRGCRRFGHGETLTKLETNPTGMSLGGVWPDQCSPSGNGKAIARGDP